MPLDPAPLGQMVAEFMDTLEEEYGPEAELLDAVIAVEIECEDEEGDECSVVEARSISKRNTVAVGITARALDAMRS